MPPTDRPPLTRGVVLRGALVAVGVALLAVSLWIVVTGSNIKDARIGLLIGIWGAFVAAAATFAVRRPVQHDEVSPGLDLALRERADVERLAEARARRDFEQRLEALLRQEIAAGVNAQVADLRSEVAQLRQDLVEKVGGQLRLERIETTRLIGSDLEALHHEVRQLKYANEGPASDGQIVNATPGDGSPAVVNRSQAVKALDAAGLALGAEPTARAASSGQLSPPASPPMAPPHAAPPAPARPAPPVTSGAGSSAAAVAPAATPSTPATVPTRTLPPAPVQSAPVSAAPPASTSRPPLAPPAPPVSPASAPPAPPVSAAPVSSAPPPPAAEAPPPPAAKASDDPFAGLPRLRPFTEFALDPIESSPSPTTTPANGHASAHRQSLDERVPHDERSANGYPGGYTGRRRSAGDDVQLPPEDAGRHAQDSDGHRHRRADEDGSGGDLLARLLAREGARH